MVITWDQACVHNLWFVWQWRFFKKEVVGLTCRSCEERTEVSRIIYYSQRAWNNGTPPNRDWHQKPSPTTTNYLADLPQDPNQPTHSTTYAKTASTPWPEPPTATTGEPPTATTGKSFGPRFCKLQEHTPSKHFWLSTNVKCPQCMCSHLLSVLSWAHTFWII